ncbi:MAG: hypothetical protein V1866_05300 [archaeon]
MFRNIVAGNKHSKDIDVLKGRIDKLEKGLERLDAVEQSLAYHETVLTKKVSDIFKIESRIQELVEKKEMQVLREELTKLEKHDELLFEQSKLIRHILNDIHQLRESSKTSKEMIMLNQHDEKAEHEEHQQDVNSMMKELDELRQMHKVKVSKGDLELLKHELHDKLNQVDYQNKIIMKYLKHVDEKVIHKQR